MGKHKVSIIVPVYNVEKYLVRCLESLINQTLKEIEIILVDDGSTDGSPKICDEYAEKDSRIVVVHKQNEGLGMARNSGLALAQGEYVVFVDSDDFVVTNAYEEMYEVIKSNKADMLMAGYYQFDTEKDLSREIKIFSEKKVIENDDAKKMSYQMVGSAPSEVTDEKIGMSVWKNMYSRAFLQRHQIVFCSEREFVSEDAIFHLVAVPKMKKIVVVNKSYYYYCKNAGPSLSSTFRESKFSEYKKLYQKEHNLLEVANLLTEGRVYIARMFLGNVRAHIKQLSCYKAYSWRKKKEIMKTIINDELLNDILNWYPYEQNPKGQRIFSRVLKRKRLKIALILARLQSMR